METRRKCLRQKVLDQIIFEGVPARIRHSGQLKKNISKLASMLKDDCFSGMPKPRVEVEKENHSEITMMAEVVNLVINKARLNLKDIRLSTPSLKQKHTLASIVALRSESIPINHHLSLEGFVEKINEQLRIKHKQRRPDAKLLSIFRRVLPRMNLQLSNPKVFETFKMPYSFDDHRSPNRFDAILANYFKDIDWAADKLMDKKVSYKDLRELFSLAPRFKEHFYEILDDKEFMNDMRADYIKLVKVCFRAFDADPDSIKNCLQRYSLPTTESEMHDAIVQLKRNCRERVKATDIEELTRASSSCTNIISKPKLRLRL